MKKADLFKTYKKHLAWMEELVTEYGKEKSIAIEQAYGYTLGITACNERYYDEITSIWNEWRDNMIWNVEQGTKQEEQEEQEEQETETEQETEQETKQEEKEENEMKIIVSWEKVRQMCINEQYYTCGDNAEYSNMFDMCEKATTVTDVKAIASDIFNHSDMEEMEMKISSYGVNADQMILIIAENIINDCSYISLGIF